MPRRRGSGKPSASWPWPAAPGATSIRRPARGGGWRDRVTAANGASSALGAPHHREVGEVLKGGAPGAGGDVGERGLGGFGVAGDERPGVVEGAGLADQLAGAQEVGVG